MNGLTVYVKTDNAAFDVHPGPEAARILREIADKIDRDEYEPGVCRTVLDANGNSVGKWRLK